MHTDTTLNIMDAVTSDLGQKLRAFQKTTCAVFKTRELRREANARIRRQKQNVQINSSQPSGSRNAIDQDQAAPSKHRSQGITQQPKTLNLNTYKFHALGDYTSTIRQYGTTDSYSTEAVRNLPFNRRIPHPELHRPNWSTALQSLGIDAQVERHLRNS